MALGTALSTLRTLLKSEIGNDLSVQTALDTGFMQLFILGQRDLADRFDWPHLKKRVDVGIDANSQYATLPNLNFERPVRVATEYNGRWLPVNYGIDEKEYNLYDFADDETSEPISKWQRYSGAEGTWTQFEVWPVPGSGQVMRFVGQQRVVDFTGENSVAYLDDLLLVYWVAATYLTRIKNPQAQIAWAKVTERMSQLRRNAPRRSGWTVIGGGTPVRRRPIVASDWEASPESSGNFFGSDSQHFGMDEGVFGDS